MDQPGFAAFVRSWHASFVYSAYLIVGDRGHAEDAVQSALMKTAAAWDRLPSDEAAAAYTRTTMIRLLGRWGRRRWHGELSTSDPADGIAESDPTLDLPSALDVRRALGALSWPHRSVLVLRFFDDLGVEQTAEVLGCSVGTVKSRTSRALEVLRRSGLLIDDTRETRHV